MNKKIFISLFIISILCFSGFSNAESNQNTDIDRFKIVREESYYLVKPENKERFLKLYREKMYPFWHKIYEMGLIVDDYKLYSHRTHELEPNWTFKTVTKFRNYTAIDKWLEIRDQEYRKIFPEVKGYEEPRKEIDLITEKHWDEFIREIPLSQ